MRNHWKTYRIERAGRWIGWSNTKRCAIANARKVPPVESHPVQVRDTRTGKIVWPDR